MKTIRLQRLLLLGLLLLPLGYQAATGDDKKAPATLGTIERKDPALDKLIPKDAVIEKLADGFSWAEGPIWVPKEGYLLFSDIPKNTIFKWKEGQGISEYMKPSGYTGKASR